MTNDNANRVAKRSAEAMWAADEASRNLGVKLEEVAPGRACLSMPVQEHMTNGHGICHGGYMFMLADSAFAFACNSYNEITVAADCQITFWRPVKVGETLTALAQEIYRSGRNGVYDVRVSNEDGDTVALFRGRSRTIGGKLYDDAQLSDSLAGGEHQ